MSSSESDFRVADKYGYVLGGDGHLATARLSLQHFLWQHILRFYVHKDVQLPPKARIADVATGTALWALEVARERPDAFIDGYDIELTQAPVAAWRPPNVSIERWDIHTDPPQERLGSYDLIHLRLVVLVITGTDPLVVIGRLWSLLKPGGWLQWEDLDCTRMHVRRADPNAKTPALDAILDMSRSGGRHDWLVNLPELLESVGFVNARLELSDDPIEISRAFNDQTLMAMDEFAASLLKMGKEEAGSQLLHQIRDGHRESLHGSALCYPRLICIAQKPAPS